MTLADATHRRTIRDLASSLDAQIVGGDPSRTINGVASLAEATPFDLSFFSNSKFAEQLRATRAAAVIVSASERSNLAMPDGVAMLVVKNADLAMSAALSIVAPPASRPPVGVDPLARVATDATLDASCAIGAFVVIGHRANIGRNVVLHPGVFIGDDVQIGDDCELFPNVVVRERITIGQRVIIHANSVLGTDGFGYTWDAQNKRHAKAPHVGTVVIEDDVEIGSCSCVDRAKFSETRVGRGTKVDNHVQIAHNVTIGAHCILAGQTGIAGSARLQDGVVIGARGGILEHVELGAGTRVAAGAWCYKSAPPKSVLSGAPARPHRRQLRETAALGRLPELLNEIRDLRAEVDELKRLAGLTKTGSAQAGSTSTDPPQRSS